MTFILSVGVVMGMTNVGFGIKKNSKPEIFINGLMTALMLQYLVNL